MYVIFPLPILWFKSSAHLILLDGLYTNRLTLLFNVKNVGSLTVLSLMTSGKVTAGKVVTGGQFTAGVTVTTLDFEKDVSAALTTTPPEKFAPGKKCGPFAVGIVDTGGVL